MKLRKYISAALLGIMLCSCAGGGNVTSTSTAPASTATLPPVTDTATLPVTTSPATIPATTSPATDESGDRYYEYPIDPETNPLFAVFYSKYLTTKETLCPVHPGYYHISNIICKTEYDMEELASNISSVTGVDKKEFRQWYYDQRTAKKPENSECARPYLTWQAFMEHFDVDKDTVAEYFRQAGITDREYKAVLEGDEDDARAFYTDYISLYGDYVEELVMMRLMSGFLGWQTGGEYTMWSVYAGGYIDKLQYPFNRASVSGFLVCWEDLVQYWQEILVREYGITDAHYNYELDREYLGKSIKTLEIFDSYIVKIKADGTVVERDVYSFTCDAELTPLFYNLDVLRILYSQCKTYEDVYALDRMLIKVNIGRSQYS